MWREETDCHDAVSKKNFGEMALAIVIPAFEPDRKLIRLIKALCTKPVAAIVVVDDGSGPKYERCFDLLKRSAKVHVLKHAVNLGKGAALKSAINYSLCAFPDHYGVVTADADGQHDPEDIVRIAERLCTNPSALVLGVRSFTGTVPLRSRLGNQMTRAVMYLLTGQQIADTQTGLRGIPRSLLLRLLKSPSTGYEFEAEMLIACKRSDCPILQEAIRTIYINKNASSHFNPVTDSLRIYFTLLRFSLASMLAAVIDNATFYLMLKYSPSLALAQIVARSSSVGFNYTANRNAVFTLYERHRVLFPKYIVLVGISGLASYVLIRIFTATLLLGTLPAKVTAESIMFVFNFVVQRDVIFRKPRICRRNDQDSYGPAIPVAGNAVQADGRAYCRR